MKVAKIDGRPAVVALKIDNGTEITSRGLRAIRVPTIAKRVVENIEQLAGDLEPTEAELAALRTHPGPLPLYDVRGDPTDLLEIAEAGASAAQLREWLDRLTDVDVSVLESKPRGRGAPPATDDELRAFARVYLEELSVGSHGAKTRTATRFGMNRTTVYAWIRACRERDHLPPESSSRSTRKDTR